MAAVIVVLAIGLARLQSAATIAVLEVIPILDGAAAILAVLEPFLATLRAPALPVTLEHGQATARPIHALDASGARILLQGHPRVPSAQLGCGQVHVSPTRAMAVLLELIRPQGQPHARTAMLGATPQLLLEDAMLAVLDIIQVKDKALVLPATLAHGRHRVGPRATTVKPVHIRMMLLLRALDAMLVPGPAIINLIRVTNAPPAHTLDPVPQLASNAPRVSTPVTDKESTARIALPAIGLG